MFRLILIPVLTALLFAQMVSPFCLALVHESRSAVGPVAGLVSDDPGAGVNAPADPEEPCWFGAAHLFNKVLIPLNLDIAPQKFTLPAPVVIAVLSPGYSPCVQHEWRAPDRSPPSPALLQIFRI